VDFVQLATSSERLDLSMEQVHINEDSALADRSLVDSGIRQKFGVIVVGISAPAARWNSTRTGSGHAPGDELVVLGRRRA
jgi:voltage-gated potassium channel